MLCSVYSTFQGLGPGRKFRIQEPFLHQATGSFSTGSYRKHRLCSTYSELEDEKCPLPLTFSDLRIIFQATASNIGKLIPLNLRSQHKL
jgi:hypothetical protein